MSCSDDFVHKGRVSRGDPPQDEERASDTTGIQKIEEIMRGLDDTAGELVPMLKGKRAVYTADVKPLFNVDGQAISHHLGR